MEGYRVGEPEETIAWRVLEFEYTELDNKETHADLTRFLGMKETPDEPSNWAGRRPIVLSLRPADWQTTLAEFRRRYGDVEGAWVCSTLKDATTHYGQFYGEGAAIYKTSYETKDVLIDLGPDGVFVLNPHLEPLEIGVTREDLAEAES
jgi:hypothetical protein